MRRIVVPVLFAASVAVVACGDTVSEAPILVPTDTGGGGMAVDCSVYTNERFSGLEPWPVFFNNSGDQPIYVVTQCEEPAFEVTLLDDEGSETRYSSDRTCATTCQSLQAGPPPDCAACATRLIRIDPGMQLQEVWQPVGLRLLVMPDACWAEGSGACLQEIDPDPDALRFEAVAYPSCEVAGQPCTCVHGEICDGDPVGAPMVSDDEIPPEVDFFWN